MVSIENRASHSVVMQHLKQELSRIAVLLDDAPCAYVDIPVYYNVGDLLINIGTENFFLQHATRVLSRFCAFDLGRYDVAKDLFEPGRAIATLDRRVKEGCTIVLQGGGNVGDLYPCFQRCREALIKRYPNTRFVQLPQSVHFVESQHRVEASQIIKNHGGVIFFCRDRASLAFVEDDCRCAGGLMPDMAHQLWQVTPFEPTWGKGHDGILYQGRHDDEKICSTVREECFDWDDLIGGREVIMRYLCRYLNGMLFPVYDYVDAYRVWYAMRDAIVQKSLRIFSGCSCIRTDRLHGMILGSILAIPVIFRDNRYGKLSRYYDAWLRDSDLITPQ